MNPGDFAALWVTLRLALVSTLILMLVGLPLAWWLARSRSRWTTLVESLVALPLVLPPTVLGFYLLIALRTFKEGEQFIIIDRCYSSECI